MVSTDSSRPWKLQSSPQSSAQSGWRDVMRWMCDEFLGNEHLLSSSIFQKVLSHLRHLYDEKLYIHIPKTIFLKQKKQESAKGLEKFKSLNLLGSPTHQSPHSSLWSTEPPVEEYR